MLGCKGEHLALQVSLLLLLCLVTEQGKAPGSGLCLTSFLGVFLMSLGNMEKKVDKFICKSVSRGEEETETQTCIHPSTVPRNSGGLSFTTYKIAFAVFFIPWLFK